MPTKNEDQFFPFSGLFGIKFQLVAKPQVSRILKSGDRTIVFWTDGTKTIVKRSNDERDSDYAAFTAALAIKIFGSNSAVKRLIERNTVVQPPKEQKHGA